MCYDIKTSLEAQLKRARHYGNEQAIEEIIEKMAPLSDLPLYHVSGFNHPKLFIYPDRTPYEPTLSTWGLVPFWVKDKSQLKKLWNRTLNARGETIFEKPSYRNSAKNKRCIIYVDGFYEHHHYAGKTFPFYVNKKNNEPLPLAGLWSEWVDTETGELINTFSIVTTEGNSMMSKIHNNPKASGPRMPLILPDELVDKWLEHLEDDLDKKAIQELIKSYPEDELKAHTVRRLRGKDYPGNVEDITKEVAYADLEF